MVPAMTMNRSVPSAADAPQRLFVALWPDAEVRARLAEVAAALRLPGRRLVPAPNLHLTLAFLGAADAGRRACIERALSDVAGSAFTLAFGTLRHRRRSAMVWLEARGVPPALDALVAAINQALAACGYAPESRPFRAHVTLARNARGLGSRPSDIGLDWHVRDFCLASSRLASGGSEYTVLRRWPLAG